MAKLMPTDRQIKGLEFLIKRKSYKGKPEQLAVWEAWYDVSNMLKYVKKTGDKELAKTYRGYLNYLEGRL